MVEFDFFLNLSPLAHVGNFGVQKHNVEQESAPKNRQDWNFLPLSDSGLLSLCCGRPSGSLFFLPLVATLKFPTFMLSLVHCAVGRTTDRIPACSGEGRPISWKKKLPARSAPAEHETCGSVVCWHVISILAHSEH